MSRKRLSRGLIATLLVVALVANLPLVPVTQVGAKTVFPDVRGHWGEPNILNWLERGLAGGHGDGLFWPDKTVDRVEFISFLNRVVGYTEAADITFSDVKKGDWFYTEVAKAIKAGYVAGFSDGTFRPYQPVTRLEAAEMLYAAAHLFLFEGSSVLDQYTDTNELSEDLKPIVNVVATKQIMVGSGGKFAPHRVITRAETIAILDRVGGDILNRAGVYGPEQGQRTIAGNVTINTTNITLQNTIVKGDLRITEGVGGGKATLNNVIVRGKTIVSGGAGATTLAGVSELPALDVIDPTGQAALLFDEASSVESVIWHSGGSLTSKNLLVPFVTVGSRVPAGSAISLTGAIGEVTVESSGVALTLVNASLDTLTVAKDSKDTVITLRESTLGTLHFAAVAEVVMPQGSVNLVTASEDGYGSTIDMAPDTTVDTVEPRHVIEKSTQYEGGQLIHIGGEAIPTTPTPGGTAVIPVTPPYYPPYVTPSITITDLAGLSLLKNQGPREVTVTASPADATLSAASGTPSVATVSVVGNKLLVTPVAIGSTTITVTAQRSGYNSATKSFTVNVEDYSGYILNITGPAITNLGASVEFTVSAQGDGLGNRNYTGTVNYTLSGNGLLEQLVGEQWVNAASPSADYTITPAWQHSGRYRFTPAAVGEHTIAFALVAGSSTLAQGTHSVSVPVGNLSGKVTFQGTELGLPKVNVTITNELTGDATSVLTNKDGDYSFSAIPAGSYTVSLTKQDFLSKAESVTVSGDTTYNCSLELAQGGVVGFVYHKVGGITLPLRDATVTLTAESTTKATTTCDLGFYLIPVVPVGEYTIEFSRAGYTPASEVISVVGPGVVVNRQLQPTTGTVSGMASYRLGDLVIPLSGAEVTLKLDGATVKTASTLAGVYLFTNVEPAAYTLEVSKAGFKTAEQQVTVAAAQSVQADFELQAAVGSVLGVVTHELAGIHIPISGVSVALGDLGTTTNELGFFMFSNLPVGTHTLQFSHSDYAPKSAEVTLSDFAAVVNVSLQTTKGAVAGLVTTKVGDLDIPVNDVTVTLSDSRSTRTIAGAYLFTDLAAGSYTLTYSKAGYISLSKAITVEAGKVATQNVELERLTGMVSGLVTYNGWQVPIPLHGVTVTLTGSDQATFTKQTELGVFAFAKVPLGEYTVEFAKEGFAPATRTITVTQNGVVLNQHLEVSVGAVAGIVTQRVFGDPIDGVVKWDGVPVPVSGVAVSVNASGIVKQTTTCEYGLYVLPMVPAGTWTMQFSHSNFLPLESEFTLAPLSFTLVNKELSPKTGTIQGKVQYKSLLTSIPIPGASVLVRDGKWYVKALPISTGVDGSFRVDNVPVGTYTLEFWQLGFEPGRLTDVAVTEGATTTANINLDVAPGTVLGYLSHKQGSLSLPLEGVGISVFNEKGAIIASGTSSPLGVYWVSGLPSEPMPGLPVASYKVVLSKPGYLMELENITISPLTGGFALVNKEMQPAPAAVGMLYGRVTEFIGLFGVGTNVGAGGVSVRVTDASNNTIATGSTTGIEFSWDNLNAQALDYAGWYYITNIPAGVYNVEFSKGTRTETAENVSIAANEFKRLDEALGIGVPEVTGIITGKGLLGDNTPISGVRVVLEQSGEQKAAATTDIFGRYTLTGVPAGTYTISFTHANYQSASDTIEVGPQGLTYNKQLQAMTGQVSGYVRHTVILPLEGVLVEARQDGVTVAHTTTSGLGLFSFAVPVGTYDLHFSKANYRSVVRSVTVNLGGFEGLEVEMFQLSNNATVTSNVYSVNNSNGTIKGVLDGTTVAAFKANLVPASYATFEVYVSDGVTLAEGNMLSGMVVVVTAEDTTTKKTYTVEVGNPVGSLRGKVENQFMGSWVGTEGVTVTVSQGGNVVASTTTAPLGLNLGEYGVSDLLEGRYTLTFVKTGFYTQSRDVDVTAGQTLAVETVRLVAKSDACSVTSSAYQVSESLLTGNSIKGVPAGTTVPEFLANLTPSAGATMQVLAQDNSVVASGPMQNGYRLRVTAENETSTKTYAVAVGLGKITGKIEHRLGLWMAAIGAQVRVYDSQDQLLGTTYADGKGNFSIDVIPGIGYTIKAEYFGKNGEKSSVDVSAGQETAVGTIRVQ